MFCRFCPECRLKVLRAYSLLVGDVEPGEEKGYKPLLYLGLKCCPAEKHIHVQCNTDLISLLITRAEPELVGRLDLVVVNNYKCLHYFIVNYSSRRERHAKTMEVAQEEVVTCVGICLLERLQRVAQRLREEEQMVDMLQFASLQALRRSFEMAVESKRGISQLELFCEELSREEAVQKQRKEAKKQKRRKRRGKKDNTSGTDHLCQNERNYDNEDDIEEAEEETVLQPAHSVQTQPMRYASIESDCSCKCSTGKNREDNASGSDLSVHHFDLNRTWDLSRSPSREYCSCSSSDLKQCNSNIPCTGQPTFTDSRPHKCPQESGYCSTNSSNLTTPEGSDVACTEGLCNHHSGVFLTCSFCLLFYAIYIRYIVFRSISCAMSSQP